MKRLLARLLGVMSLAACLLGGTTALAQFQPPEVPCGPFDSCNHAYDLPWYSDDALLTCNGGFCRAICNEDADCPGSYSCQSGLCRPIDIGCRSDDDCGRFGLCDQQLTRWQCVAVDCKRDGDCLQPGRCVDNACRQAECTRSDQCRFSEFCNADDRCERICARGELYVRSGGFPPCTACVPFLAPRANSAAECALDRVFATTGYGLAGFCIPACSRTGTFERPGDRMLIDPGLLDKPAVQPPAPQPDREPPREDSRAPDKAG